MAWDYEWEYCDTWENVQANEQWRCEWEEYDYWVVDDWGYGWC